MSEHSNTESNARQRAEEKVGFYIHAIVYVVVNAGLTVLDLTTSPNRMWFYWVLGGWGIGLILHAVKVYSADGPNLKDRLIEREMARESS